MKLKLKEDRKEWRKSALMSALGLAILSSVLRWRHVLPARAWEFILGFLAVAAMTALMRPQAFRGYYRFSMKVGFGISRMVGFITLAMLFFIVITPLGLFLRIFGKDPLRLRRSAHTESYWSPVRGKSSLDRLF